MYKKKKKKPSGIDHSICGYFMVYKVQGCGAGVIIGNNYRRADKVK